MLSQLFAHRWTNANRTAAQPARSESSLRWWTFFGLLTWVWGVALPTPPAGAQSAELTQAYDQQIGPLIERYCGDCHGANDPAATLNLLEFKNVNQIVDQFAIWQLVVERVELEEMPPQDATIQPTPSERAAITGWIEQLKTSVARERAGDPGSVLPHRLNAAEYNYTIQDLTGYPIEPAREFPIDPANEAGFDNSGESLSMTPALLNKYLAAAQQVADHLVFTPSGLRFAPHPVVTDTDRDKYAVRRIVDFYEQQNTTVSDYLFALWWRQSTASDERIEAVVLPTGLSERYLSTLAELLGMPAVKQPAVAYQGPLQTLRRSWQELPASRTEHQAARQKCELMARYIQAARTPLAHQFPILESRGINRGSQSLVLFRNRQYATHRRKMNTSGLRAAVSDRVEPSSAEDAAAASPDATGSNVSASNGPASDSPVTNSPDSAAARSNKPDTEEPDTEEPDAEGTPDGSPDGPTIAGADEPLTADNLSAIVARDLTPPADGAHQTAHRADCETFCSIFPDAFYVAQRGREFINRDAAELDQEKKVRLLSAGFHSMMGYFRDDQPLMELMLTAEQQSELNRLWEELDFITSAPTRQHAGFIWYERAESRFLITEEFDFARSEDRDSTSAAKLQQLAEVYLAKAERLGASEVIMQAVREHFENTNRNIRWLEQARQLAEPQHVAALHQLAAQAYRRPLSAAETASLSEFYRVLRERDGLTHEDAVRDTFISLLMSPYFCYRGLPAEPASSSSTEPSQAAPSTNSSELPETTETPETTEPLQESSATVVAAAAAQREPLSEYELASRLSYFLWSSMPDDDLLAAAAAGRLQQRDELLAQTRRMLSDARVARWATEFGGQWLDFRQFQQHNSVDRERFPAFDDTLRSSMFQEPIRFLTYLIQHDQSLLDGLYARYTLVNQPLAQHYGLAAEWESLAGSKSPVPDTWLRIDDAERVGRGGLLPMSVFLTKNSPGLRTSPVKRGYWVVRQVLGERIPPPPPNVPELPSDEAKLGDLTLRELLAAHRAHPSCAGCHEKFDSMGLVFEGFGPVGEARKLDLGGKPVQQQATWPDGSSGEGVGALRDYIRQHREADYVDNFCRKLLAYALGRTLLISDEPLIADMQAALKAHEFRPSVVFEVIVTSPQFTHRRG